MPEEEKSGVDKVVGSCFGTWDPRFEECASKCTVAEKCRKAQTDAGKPKPADLAKQVTEPEEELPEMEPFAYLLFRLSGKYKQQGKEKGGEARYRFLDGKRVHARIVVAKNGKMLIETDDVKIQLNEGLKTTQQVSYLFRAFLA